MNSDSDNSTLADKVAFLSNPESWPGTPSSVETVETHMSWVFLGDDDVYKLKKPIRLPFLDFTTLEARRRNCHIEFTLNKRLAAGVYLGVEPLVRDRREHLALGRKGQPVEWLVHMRRLPRDRMLDTVIAEGRTDEQELRPAARLLTEFYARAVPLEYSGETYRQRLLRYIENNRQALCHYLDQADEIDYLSACQRRFVDQASKLFDHRAGHGHIIEAHGDLRPEHICLVDPPVILDCLEFNREFRLLDPVDELAFLRVECDMADADDVGQLFLDIYTYYTGDCPPSELVGFYRCYRACLRAKLAVWHLQDDPLQERGDWLQKAGRYLSRAAHYAGLFDGG